MQHEYPLRIVEEIARAKSIRGAADFLSITPSALNRRLLGLEDELGTQLFERFSNGVILNAAGEIFIAHARRQLADMKAVRSKIADIKGARRGRVVIAIDDSIKTGGAIAHEMSSYQNAFEGVSFTVEQTNTRDIAKALVEYRIDLALQLHPRTNTHVTSLCSAPAHINVVARPEHPALSNDQLSFHEIVQYPWTLPQRRGLRSIIEAAVLRQSLPFRISLESTLGVAQPIILGSDTVGFEVDTLSNHTANDGLARCLLNPRDHPQLFIHLAQLRNRSLSVAAGRFAERVKKSYAALS